MILKDCIKGKVYAPGEDRYWPCRVEYNDEEIILYLENYEGSGHQFGTRVDFYDEVVGVVVTDSEVRIRINPRYPEEPERWIGECRIRNIDTIVQRHLDVRVNVELGVQFRTEEGDSFVGCIRNISAGGVYVVTDTALPLGARISFSYAFRNQERPYVVEILWGQREKESRFGYGCRFLDLTNGAESAVRNYVFGKLREQARVEKMRKQGEDGRDDDFDGVRA
jgi:hypothetical protein